MTNRSFDEVPNIVIQDNDRIVPKSTGTPSPSSPQPSSSGMTVFALLLALVASGAAGYLFWQGQQQIMALSAAEQRITDLENRLSATGEEMGNSTVALQVKVTELSNRADALWEQMDKLWASAWRRNQKDIQDLEALVNKQASKDKSARGKLDKSIKQVDKKFDALQNDFSATQNEILAVNLELEGIKQGLLGSQDANAVLNDKIAILEQRNANLKAKVTALEKMLASLRPMPSPSP